MSFHVHVSDADQRYLDGLSLSPEGRGRVDQFIRQFIANVSDEFRLDPENRPVTDSPCFRAQFVFLDFWGDGRLHAVDFHVQDDQARFGVLLVVYVDHEVIDPR